MIKDIYTKLKDDSLNPYFTGQQEGICKIPYTVVKKSNQIPSLKSNKLGTQVIEVMVFVPIKSFIRLEQYVKSIKDSLEELDYLRKTGYESEVYIDEEKLAYMVSIEYVLQKII